MTIFETLKEIGDTRQPLQMSKLKALSNPEPLDQAALLQNWLQIEPTRRREISAAMVSLAEDDVEFNFHDMLLMALDDSDEGVRAHALSGLWELNSLTLMRRMVTMLQNDPSGEVRAAAALGLGRFMQLDSLEELPAGSCSEAHATLYQMARDQQQPMEVRRRAIESLGYRGNEPEIAVLIEAAAASNEQLMRESALVAMGRSMQERWLPTIDRSLHSPSPALRYEAARAVGEMSDLGAPLIPTLLQLVDDEDSEVSMAAIWALGQVGGPHAKRVLQRMSRSKNEARRQAALDALDELALGEDDLKLI